ncbi:MAG: hemolysin III family protein [Acidobacteriota bacterium]|nr:hemolysin III family protein [Acidobacteriota bacterium]
MEMTDQTVGEEIANSVSHGLGMALSIAGLVLLSVRAWDAGGVRSLLCVTVFGASSILLYLSSTLYHAMSRTRAYRVLRSMDHGSIYLLIAGTYTPFTLIGLRGPLGWTMFAIVWSCAAVGVLVKTFATGRWDAVSTAMYLAMGWICLFAIRSMYMLLAHPVFAMLMAGGICYTAGIPFYASKRKYMHFIWHLWVLAGTACHFAAVWMMLR